MRYVVAFIGFVFLTSCSFMPPATTYETVFQEKMNSAEHWRILAEDTALEINNTLIKRGFLESEVYVKPRCGDEQECTKLSAPFFGGFKELLITKLVGYGVPVLVDEQDDGLVVEYDIQMVYHPKKRPQPWPGTATALSTAIVVFRDAAWQTQSIAAGIAADVMGGMMVTNSNYEVIITTSISAEQIFIMRKTDVYYISDPDFWHYQLASPASEINMIDSGW